MNLFQIDIYENEILKQSPELLSILLKDYTLSTENCQVNIFWATNNYMDLGVGYQYYDYITIESITGKNGEVIKPRSIKSRELQKQRSREMAEVFTPSWVCNAQNNLVDEAWFGRKDVFNTEYTNEQNCHRWKSSEGKIQFPDGKTWKDYVRNTRLEITCGEAPYLVSRYDTTNGEAILINERVGILDRKLRVVAENTETSEEWLKWAQEAYKSTYGYEWQGDNLLIARENFLMTFIEYYQAKFNRTPQLKSLLYIAEIISWNLWQMDGLKCVVPNSCGEKPSGQYSLFNEPEMIQCEGCKSGNIHKHNGIYCLIKDWRKNEALTFVSLMKEKK